MKQLYDLMELNKLDKDQLIQLCEALYALLGEQKVQVTLQPVPAPVFPLSPVPYYPPTTVPMYGDAPYELRPTLTCETVNEATV